MNVRPTIVLWLVVVLAFFAFGKKCSGDDALPAFQRRTAILLDELRGQPPSIESITVRDIAKRIFGADILHVKKDGRLENVSGTPISLDDYSVLWFHRADIASENIPFCSPAFVQALKRFVEAGNGVLLTGGATGTLEPLELDTIQTKPLEFGNDRAQSGFLPQVAAHPIFTDLNWERDILWLSNVVYPCWSHFQAEKGRVLGINPELSNIPCLEYTLGRGKIIAAPWHVGAIYDKAPAGHRRNFEQLTSNIVRYLDGSLVVDAPLPSKLEAEIQALERALRHIVERHGDQYPNGKAYLEQLDFVRKLLSDRKDEITESVAQELDILRREALLAHPLLNFDCFLLIRRAEKQLGLPWNYHANSTLPKQGYGNSLVVVSDWKSTPILETVIQPENGRFIGDVDLHFDADRLLFSMVNEKGLWRVYESNIDGSKLRELPLIPDEDVDCYDPCYLPDGGIVFCSTACFAGVPCVNGTAATCNLYRMDSNGAIRQLTYEQDQDWCPTVMNNGRLLYLRWEYTDIPHAFSRILFHANPDGTNQAEYYGSGSYWPATMFFAKPIPNHPTKFVAVVGGHHELPRMGDLVLFDPALGRWENTGAIQRIPGYGREVQPVMLDLPIARTWPKFLHPAPLDENFFLVSAKPTPNRPWGIYLVDTFDNMVLIHEEPGYALFEPIPLQKRPTPPIIPDRTDTDRQDAEMFIADIYQGQGLRGVKRGTVKALRLYSYQFSYQGMGAEPYSIGLDGPWDPRRIIGTVPIYDDGSAYFSVPAYTPIAMQPLDDEGKAIQVMRSWVTAMPGEVVSCVGCHEEQNTAVASIQSKASRKAPSAIEPWYGPARGFSFVREVQPVLDKYCTECHFEGNERFSGIISFHDSPPQPMLDNKSSYINVKSRFSRSYYELRRFVRSSTKEGTMQVPHPWEYHADTTRLIQMLKKGHGGVHLDQEAWDRLITWIDLNAPFHGKWRDIIMDDNPQLVKNQFARRHDLRRRYAGTESLLDDDPELEYLPAQLSPKPVQSSSGAETKEELVRQLVKLPDPVIHHFDPLQVVRLSLTDQIEIEMVPIPAGEFVMGDEKDRNDKKNRLIRIDKPFLMARTEITNRQYAVFDQQHDSRIEFGDFMHFSPGEKGWSLAHPDQPVVRVSWNRATDFCRWLSRETGRTICLPTEQQWEYAARAGTNTPFWYGTGDTDFSPYANLSDISNQQISSFGWSGRVETLPAWRPADVRFNDYSRVSTVVGSYAANPWGLFDMHGNVSEWTASSLSEHKNARKIVKGGSWYDTPKRARAAFRQDYLEEQPIYDVGFRIIIVD